MSTYKTDPANVYFTANFINTNPINSVDAALTSYRTTPILNSPGEYYMRIDDFYISGVIIPFMILSPTSLSISIDALPVGGLIRKAYIPLPINSNNPDFDGYIYYVQTFVNSVNRTLQYLHGQVLAGLSIASEVPKFLYANGKFSFKIPGAYVNNNITIWFNTALGSKLSSFALFYDTYASDLGSGQVYKLKYLFDDPDFVPTSTNSGYITQPYDSLFLLSDLRRLVVTTTQMPTLRQYYMKSQEQTATETRGVLFTVPINDFAKLSEGVSYKPGSSKLIDLISQEPLSTIDVQVYYELVDGRIFPVPLIPGKSFSIEFAFIHKSIYDNAYTFNKLDL